MPKVEKIPIDISKCYEIQDKGKCVRTHHPKLLHQPELCYRCYQSTIPSIDKWYKKGIECGKYYKAWVNVLANNEIFDDFLEANKSIQDENIDWISLYNEIDTEKTFIQETYVTSSVKQKRNFYSKASFRITEQLIQNFKNETNLHDNNRKLDYINSLNIDKPSIGNTTDAILNQTIFAANCNFFHFLELYKIELEESIIKQKQENEAILEDAPPQNEKEVIQESENENDIILSTIEDFLFAFKEKAILSDSNYEILVNALTQYFKFGTFPNIKKPISVSNVNKKKIGWVLNEIFRAIKDNNEKLPIEYLKFAKHNISIFKNVSFDEDNFLKSNLYKYFTTKTL